MSDTPINKEVPTREEFVVVDTMRNLIADISLLRNKIRELPKSRERAIINTKLEEAGLYAELDVKLNCKI